MEQFLGKWGKLGSGSQSYEQFSD